MVHIGPFLALDEHNMQERDLAPLQSAVIADRQDHPVLGGASHCVAGMWALTTPSELRTDCVFQYLRRTPETTGFRWRFQPFIIKWWQPSKVKLVLVLQKFQNVCGAACLRASKVHFPRQEF